MGLSNHLNDVSSDSIPILLVVFAATWVSYLRSHLLCFFHHLGLLHRPVVDPAVSVGSGLAGLILLSDHLSSNRPFSYEVDPDCGVDDDEVGPDCVVCLCGLRDGDRVRRLSCCHVFHSECLDGWFDQMNLNCPLCRSPLVAEECRADAERRIGAELVAWLSPY